MGAKCQASPTADAKTAGAAPAGVDARPTLIGLGRSALGAELQGFGLPAKEAGLRARQIWHWLYSRGASDFSAMTTLSKSLREALGARYGLARPEILHTQVSSDGTRKWLLRFAPGIEAETVFIPEADRGTLCVSAQVGCTLNCRFCHTGTQALVRNLSAAEIVSQVLIARDALGEWPTPQNGVMGGRKLTNIVFMGMGEPLYNFDHVAAAIAIMADGEGLSVSKRRITVSTAGVVPQIARLGAEVNAMLAISLHAVRDDLRDELVPLNRKYNLQQLMAACRAYPGLSNARRITFEYVMLKGVNDSLADARGLVRLIAGIPAKINLIPFNPWPGAPYQCTDWDQIEVFADIVNRAGYASPVRTPRGRDIAAACGQLKSESRKLRARARAENGAE